MSEKTKNLGLFKYIPETDGKQVFSIVEALNNNWDILDEKGAGSGFNLFDTKLVDHVLEGKEAEGWALQGTYVYKDAIAGSRNGYPDFYNKCLEEYRDSENQKQWLKSYFSQVGTITDNHGILSGFSTANYIYPDTGVSFASVASKADTWEEVIKFQLHTLGVRQTITGGNSGTYTHDIYVGDNNKLYLALSSNGTSYNIASDVAGSLISTNIWYWVKLQFTGSQYILSYSTNGIDFITDIVVDSTTKIESTTDLNYFGCRGGLGSPINGNIDLLDTYIKINNSLWWKGADCFNCKQHANGHLFYNIDQKAQVDEIFTSTGMAWMYGIDTEKERIFLPRDNFFAIKGIAPVAGTGMTLGLIDGNGGTFGIFGQYGQAHGSYNSSHYGINLPSNVAANSSGWPGSNTALGVTTDATKSGMEAHLKSNEEKYLYICVGNTEVKSMVTNVVDVTTTENDTIPLFTGMYFDFKPNNLSWIKGGSTKSQTEYPTCYNELVNILNGEYKYGDLNVIDKENIVLHEDYSLYWIVDQTNLTFTTPTQISSKSYKDIAQIYGTGKSLGLTNGVENCALTTSSQSYPWVIKGAYDSLTGIAVDDRTVTGARIPIGVTTDPTKSGIEAHLVENTTAQLYFKVANAVQNLELLNVGKVMENAVLRSSLIQANVVTETYTSGPSWYRVWSDGWCEQGGFVHQGAVASLEIAFLKAYKDLNYSIVVCPSMNNADTGGDATDLVLLAGDSSLNYYCGKASTGFRLSTYSNTNAACNWYACGYIR